MLLGCSMHPLPENFPLNFPRASTFDIVQKVRCEVQAGLNRFKSSRHPERIDQIVRATSIGYDFKLVMAETDSATDGALDFTRKGAKKGSKDSLTAGVSAGARKTRLNTRTFRIVEDLGDVAKADCSAETVRANLAYPIVGSLRVDDVVSSYIRLERMTNLDVDAEDVAEFEGDPKKRSGVFSDHLLFNTRLSLDKAAPTLTMTAVAGSFKLTNAAIVGGAARSDQHSLIIAFAQDPDFHKTEIANAAAQRSALVKKRQRVAPVEAVPLSVISGPRTQTDLVAANARARNKVLLELARLRNLADDEEESSKFLGQRLLTFLRPPEETGPGERP
jgi:hypothetical protein